MAGPEHGQEARRECRFPLEEEERQQGGSDFADSYESTMSEGTTQMFKEMMSAIQELKSEVADLQGERRGSRPRRETHTDEDMVSTSSFVKVQK